MFTAMEIAQIVDSLAGIRSFIAYHPSLETCNDSMSAVTAVELAHSQRSNEKGFIASFIINLYRNNANKI